MSGGLTDPAEWLGYEVVKNSTGEWVVRQRWENGEWTTLEDPPTPAEVTLYDAVRGLLVVPEAGEFAAMRLVATALSLSTSNGVSLGQVLHSIASLMEESRRRMEAYQRAEGLVNELRQELLAARENVERLLAVPRIAPKGGDRNELARQIRHTAKAAGQQRSAQGRPEVDLAFTKGVTAMANTILRLLGESPLHHTTGQKDELLEVPEERNSWKEHSALLQMIHQLKADRFVAHAPGSRPYERNAGEQNAFNMVIRLMETGEVPS